MLIGERMIQSGDQFNINHEGCVSGPYTCSFTAEGEVYYYNPLGELMWRGEESCILLEPDYVFSAATEKGLSTLLEVFPHTPTTEEEKDTLTRLEFIGNEGRVFVRYAKEGKKFKLSFQDDGRTLKVFEENL